MIDRLFRYASPSRWRRFAESRLELIWRRRADAALDATWRGVGPVQLKPGNATVIADGLWLNPGYFLRLRLVIDALARREAFDLFGLIRSSANFRNKRSLERIGFSDFVYIDADGEFPISKFQEQARALLKDAKTHEDLLRIRLPHGFPAYFWYDTVLKNTRHGRPPLGHPEWQKSLAMTLAYLAIYDRILRERNVTQVLLSHAWKSEWAAMAWLALARGIPTFHVTAFSDAIRIRRFRTFVDLTMPAEYFARAAFDALPVPARKRIIDFGAEQLALRQANQTSDINTRHAYVPERRTTDRAKARAMLGVTDDRPIGVIYGHSWFDFPHLYGMQNFTDYVDWFELTLKRIAELDNINWMLKPHPLEGWYGGYKMIENLGNLPPHVHVMSTHVDTLTVMSAADAIVTVHGTAALEAAANGVPVIAADRSYYSDWGFAYVASDQAEYLELLSRVGKLPCLTPVQRDLALACFALAQAEPNPEIGALRVPCDSLGSDLYDRVRGIVSTMPQALSDEVDRLSDFLSQDEIHSFAAYALVRWASRTSDAAAA